MMSRRRLDLGDPESGSAALEAAIIAPALLFVLILAIALGRVTLANTAIDGAAADGARAASIARDPGTAQANAQAAVSQSMRQHGLDCTPQVSVDTSGFATPPGQTAVVQVHVQCQVPLGDLSIPGMPGSKTLSAAASSVLDTYRER